MPSRCSTPSAVLALPCGSRSITRIRSPCRASAAATLTAVVVLPTPPFWLAIVKTRWRAGRGSPPLAAACKQPHRALRLGADRGVQCRLRRPTIPAGPSPMFHVKHPGAALPREARRRPWVRPRGPDSSSPPARSWRPVRYPNHDSRAPAAPRRRSRVDPSSPRHISSPLHRPHPATPSHAGAPGSLPPRARP